MKNSNEIIKDFAEKNNCTVEEATKHIELLIKQTKLTNEGSDRCFTPYFKQSKSIENASIYLGDSKETIKDNIMCCFECNEYDILKMIEQGTNWTDKEIEDARTAFKNKLVSPNDWKSTKQKFCNWFISIKEIWDFYKENTNLDLTELLYKE